MYSRAEIIESDRNNVSSLLSLATEYKVIQNNNNNDIVGIRVLFIKLAGSGWKSYVDGSQWDKHS